jgi:hypothetical protein
MLRLHEHQLKMMHGGDAQQHAARRQPATSLYRSTAQFNRAAASSRADALILSATFRAARPLHTRHLLALLDEAAGRSAAWRTRA